MKHTTHELSTEKKEELFDTHKGLITMIHTFGDMLLRKQIKRLYHLLTGISETEIEFAIAELINSGFLLQKQICKDSRTQMLYLSKYPRSKFMVDTKSGDVPALAFSNQKIFEQIFLGDYIIETLIPAMKAQNYEVDLNNLITYIKWVGSTLLLPSNQYYNLEHYERVIAVTQSTHKLTYDLHRDMEIASWERESFLHKRQQLDTELPICSLKQQRDTERSSYNSDIERNKYYFNLINMAKYGYTVEGIEQNTIRLIYFDSMNSIQTKKLYQTLCYILLMFQRYLNTDITLSVTVYTWNTDRAEHLRNEETKQAYDFFNQEWTNTDKKHHILQSVGLLPSNWDSINVEYKNFDIYTKYNVHP